MSSRDSHDFSPLANDPIISVGVSTGIEDNSVTGAAETQQFDGLEA